jgi:drug/metabolite transporter (DMT)-like permease
MPAQRFQLRSHRTAVWLALLVTFLWSTSWVLIRWGLDDEGLRPLTFAALRYGLAAALLVIVAIVSDHRRPRLRHAERGFLLRLVVLGIVMYALTQGAMFVALDAQPAATTSLILSLTPLLVAGGAAVTLSEVPSRTQIGGATIVLVGAGCYFAGDLGATSVGLMAAVTALFANVAAAIIGRSVNRSEALPAEAVTAVSMTVGAGVLVLLALGLEGMPVISLRGWLIIGWLALVNTALAFTLWNLSLQRLSAIESAGINNTMLVQIALLAWLLLGESPGLLGLLGIALVSSGVYLVQVARRPRGDLQPLAQGADSPV